MVVFSMPEHSKVSRDLSGLARELGLTTCVEAISLRAAIARIERDPGFSRGFAMYRRIADEARFDHSVVGESDRLDGVRRDFTLFMRAHLLRATGRSIPGIIAEIGDSRALGWVRDQQVPESLFFGDPLRVASFKKHVTRPREESADFAYLCGAYAGTRRRGTVTDSLVFRSHDRAVIERVVEAAARGCGYGLVIKESTLRGQTLYSAGSRAGEFLNLLSDLSDGNSGVPWEHLQTSVERRAFLRGFFDYSGGSIRVVPPRFIVSRLGNAELLEEVALILKREGIVGRISYNRLSALHIESRRGLEGLRRAELISGAEARATLEAALAQPMRSKPSSVEEYYAVMAAARRVPGYPNIRPGDVRAILEREGSPYVNVPRLQIRGWTVHQRIPLSIARAQHLGDIEERRLSPTLCNAIGEAILTRRGDDLTPGSIVRAIAEFWGGPAGLSDRSRVPSPALTEIISRKRLPSRAEYRLILESVGLKLDGAIAEQSEPPHPWTVEQWLKPHELPVFRTYQPAVMLAVRDTFQAGGDLRDAARRKIDELQRRSARTNRPPTM